MEKVRASTKNLHVYTEKRCPVRAMVSFFKEMPRVFTEMLCIFSEQMRHSMEKVHVFTEKRPSVTEQQQFFSFFPWNDNAFVRRIPIKQSSKNIRQTTMLINVQILQDYNTCLLHISKNSSFSFRLTIRFIFSVMQKLIANATIASFIQKKNYL